MMLLILLETPCVTQGLDVATCLELPMFNDTVLLIVVGAIGLVVLVKIIAYALQSIPL